MKVKLIANGPICIDTAAPVSIRQGDAAESKPGPVFLCRCGQSATKPYCDGTHRKVKFEAPAAELDLG